MANYAVDLETFYIINEFDTDIDEGEALRDIENVQESDDECMLVFQNDCAAGETETDRSETETLTRSSNTYDTSSRRPMSMHDTNVVKNRAIKRLQKPDKKARDATKRK